MYSVTKERFLAAVNAKKAPIRVENIGGMLVHSVKEAKIGHILLGNAATRPSYFLYEEAKQKRDDKKPAQQAKDKSGK